MVPFQTYSRGGLFCKHFAITVSESIPRGTAFTCILPTQVAKQSRLWNRCNFFQVSPIRAANPFHVGMHFANSSGEIGCSEISMAFRHWCWQKQGRVWHDTRGKWCGKLSTRLCTQSGTRGRTWGLNAAFRCPRTRSSTPHTPASGTCRSPPGRNSRELRRDLPKVSGRLWMLAEGEPK